MSMNDEGLSDNDRLSLRYILLSAEMNRINGQDPSRQLNLEEVNANKDAARELGNIKNKFDDLHMKLKHIDDLAHDCMLSPRTEELNYVSGGHSLDLNPAKGFRPQDVTDLLNCQKDVQGQNNSLIGQKGLIKKEVGDLKDEIMKINNFLINEGTISDQNKKALVGNLDKLVSMKFAQKEHKMIQVPSFNVMKSVGCQFSDQNDLVELLRKQLENKETLVRKLYDEIAELKRRLESMPLVQTRAISRENEIDPQMEKLRHAHSSGLNKITSLEDKIKELEELLSNNQKELEDKNKDNIEKDKEIKKLLDELRKAQETTEANARNLKNLNEDLLEISDKLKRRTEELKDLEAKFKDLGDKHFNMASELSVAKANETGLKAQMALKDEEIARLKKQNDIMDQQIRAMSNAGAVVPKIVDNSENLKLSQQVSELSGKLDSMENENRSLKNELERLKDQVRSLTGDKDTLQRQLKEEKEQHKHAQDELEKANKEKKILDDKVKNLTSDLEGLNQKIAQLKNDRETLRGNLEKLERELNGLKTDNGALKSNLESLTRENKDLQARLKDLEGQVDQKTDEIRDLKRKLAERDSKLEDKDNIEKELAEVKAKLAKANDSIRDKDKLINDTQYQVEGLQKDNGKLEKQVKDLQAQLKDLQRDFDTYKEGTTPQKGAVSQAQVDRLKQELEDKNRQIETLQNDLQAKSDQNNKLKNELGTLRHDLEDKADALARAMKKAEQNEARLQRELEELKAKLDETSKERDELKKQLSETKSQLQGKTEEADGLRRERNSLKVEVEDLQKRLDAANSKLKALTDAVREKEDLIEDLKKKNKDLERELARTIEEATSYANGAKAKIEGLAKEVARLESELQALKSQNQSLMRELESYKNDVPLTPRELIPASQYNRVKQELEDKKVQVENMQNELKEKNDQINKLKQELQNLRSEVGSLRTDLDKKTDELDRAQKKSEATEARLNKVLEDLKATGDALLKDNSDLKAQNRDLKSQLQTKIDESEALKKEIRALKESIEDLQRRLDSSINKSKTLTDTVKERDDTIDELNKKIVTLQKELLKLDELGAEISNLKKNRDRLLQEAEAANSEIESLKKKLKDKQQEITQLILDLEQAKTPKPMDNSALLEAEKMIKDLQSAQRQAQDDLANLKSLLSQKEKAVASLNDQLHHSQEETTAANKKLKEKILECQSLQGRLDDDKTKYDRSLKEKNEEIDRLSQLAKQLRDQLDKSPEIDKSEFDRMKAELRQVKQKLEEAEEELAKCKRQLKQRDQQLSDLQDRLQQTSESAKLGVNFKETDMIDDLNRKITKLNKKVDDLTAENEGLLKKIADFEKQENREIAALKERVNSLMEEVRNKTAKEDELRSQNANLKREMEELNRTIEKLVTKEKRLVEALSEIQDLESKLSIAKRQAAEVEILTEKNAALMKRLSELNTEKDKLEEQINSLKRLQREIDSLEDKCSMLTKKLGEATAARDELQDQVGSLKRALSEANALEDKLSIANKKVITLEKEKEDLLAKLAAMKELERIIEKLKDERSSLQKNYDKLHEQIAGLESEIQNLNKRLKDKQTEAFNLETQVADMRSKLKTLADQDEDNKRAIKDANSKLNNANEEIDRVKGIVKHKEREIESLIKSIDDEKRKAAKAADEFNEIISKLRRRITELESTQQSLPVQQNIPIPNFDQEREKLNKTINDLKQQLHQAESEAAENDRKIKEKVGLLQRTIDDKTSQLDQVTQAAREKELASQKLLREAAMKLDEAERDAKDLKTILGEAKEALGDRSIPDRRVPPRILELKDQLTKTEQKLRAAESELETIRAFRVGNPEENTWALANEIKQLKEALRRVEEERDGLKAQLATNDRERGLRASQTTKDLQEMENLRAQLAKALDAQAAAERLAKERLRAIEGFLDDPTSQVIMKETREFPGGDKSHLLDTFIDQLKRYLRKEKADKDGLSQQLEDLRQSYEQKIIQLRKELEQGARDAIEAVERELKKKNDEVAKYKKDLSDLQDKYENLLTEYKRLRADGQNEDPAIQAILAELHQRNEQLLLEVRRLEGILAEERRKADTAHSRSGKLREEVAVLENKLLDAKKKLDDLDLELNSRNQELRKMRNTISSLEQYIIKIEGENKELKNFLEANLEAMQAKLNKEREKLAMEQAARQADIEAMDAMRKRIEEMGEAITELRSANKLFEEQRVKDQHTADDFRKREDALKDAESRMLAHRQKLQDKERLLAAREQYINQLEAEKKAELDLEAQRVKDEADSVYQWLKPELLNELIESEKEGSPFYKFLKVHIKGIKSPGRIMEEFARMIVRLNSELHHKGDELVDLREKLAHLTAKYTAVKDAYVKADKDCKKMAEDIKGAENHIKAINARNTGNHEEHDKIIREMLGEKNKLLDVISALNHEKDGLIGRINDFKRAQARQRNQGSPRSPMKGDGSTINLLIENSPQTHKRSNSYSQLPVNKTPTRVDIHIDQEPPIPVMINTRGEKTIAREPSTGKLRDKENIPQNSPGRLVPPRGKKLIASWTHLNDLIDSFEGLLREYERVNGQIQKDKTRLEALAAKKPDLNPYLKDISKILASPSVEQLFKNKRDLETAEAEQLAKAISMFEKLAEEFGYVYANYSEKLKNKQGDYVRWNKQLAAYCNRVYPK
jgi:chromosome segregation ATPase